MDRDLYDLLLSPCDHSTSFVGDFVSFTRTQALTTRISTSARSQAPGANRNRLGAETPSTSRARHLTLGHRYVSGT